MFFLLSGKNIDFFVTRDIAHGAAHGKTVHLGFGQRVGAPELDGVLRRDDKKVFLQHVRFTFNGCLPLGHGFKQGGLGARGGAIDFVGEENVAKNGAGVELELIVLGVPHRDAQDVVGKQVGGELDAIKHCLVDGQGKGLRQRRLSGARVIFEQNMSSAEKGGYDMAYALGLAANDLR